MNASTAKARFQLYYWSIPFRGCFVSYLFAWADQPLEEHFGFDAVARIKNLHPAAQPAPAWGRRCFTIAWLGNGSARCAQYA